jgi:hypothetical protein
VEDEVEEVVELSLEGQAGDTLSSSHFSHSTASWKATMLYASSSWTTAPNVVAMFWMREYLRPTEPRSVTRALRRRLDQVEAGGTAAVGTGEHVLHGRLHGREGQPPYRRQTPHGEDCGDVVDVLRALGIRRGAQPHEAGVELLDAQVDHRALVGGDGGGKVVFPYIVRDERESVFLLNDRQAG